MTAKPASSPRISRTQRSWVTTARSEEAAVGLFQQPVKGQRLGGREEGSQVLVPAARAWPTQAPPQKGDRWREGGAQSRMTCQPGGSGEPGGAVSVGQEQDHGHDRNQADNQRDKTLLAPGPEPLQLVALVITAWVPPLRGQRQNLGLVDEAMDAFPRLPEAEAGRSARITCRVRLLPLRSTVTETLSPTCFSPKMAMTSLLG